MSRSQVIERLRRRLGLDPESIGEITLNHAIDEACTTLMCADVDTLLARIDRDERDWQRFVDCMVVPETWLFRSPEQFEDLTRFVREQLGDRRPLRILSLPCATGEEAYSIAASLLAHGLGPGAFEILGIDVSERAITSAVAARYRSNSARGRSIDTQWFERDGEFWVPAPAVRRSVRFRRGNLLQADCFEPDERFDVVFFRNLLIYLDVDARRRALDRIMRVLDRPGLMLAGQAENLAAIDARLQPLAGYGPLSFGHARHPSEPASAQSASPLAVARAAATEANPPTRTRPAAPRPNPVAAVASAADLITEARQAADAGQFERARMLCLQLLESQPESASAWLLRGLIAMAQGDLDEAEQALVRAGYLDRDDTEAVHYRIALAERRGHTDEAANLRSRVARMSSTRTRS
jgi:chemotaxis protein methyltransferase WspC